MALEGCDTVHLTKSYCQLILTACEPATEKAVEPTDDDTRGTSFVHCPPIAHALFLVPSKMV